MGNTYCYLNSSLASVMGSAAGELTPHYIHQTANPFLFPPHPIPSSKGNPIPVASASASSSPLDISGVGGFKT